MVAKVSDLQSNALEDTERALCRGMLDLVAEQIPFPEDANEVVLHEMVGHFGLRDILGPNLDNVLLDIHENNPLVKQFAAERRNANKDFQKKSGMSDTGYYYRSVEEAMAIMAQVSGVRYQGFILTYHL